MYLCLNSNVIITESTCPIPPTFAYSVAVEFAVEPDTFVTYECTEPQYMFDDGSRRKRYHCVNFVWTETLADCAREYQTKQTHHLPMTSRILQLPRVTSLTSWIT